MGIVKFTETAPQIRGSIGGTTYSVNAAGNIARRRQKPLFPKTDIQCRRSADLGHFSEIWHLVLSDANRIAWNTLAAATTWTNKLGEEYSPTGHNLYVRSTTILAFYENGPITGPPAVADEGPYSFTLGTDGSNNIVLTDIGTCPLEPHGYCMVWWSRPQRASRYAPPSHWYYLKTLSFQVFDIPEILVLAADCPADFRYHFRFRVSRTAGTVGWPNIESMLKP